MVWACPPPPPPPALPACVVREARWLARNLHDRHPKWVHAVETTYDQAEAAIDGKRPGPPSGIDVYVIEVKGKLVDEFDSVDPFDPQPHRGRFYVMVLNKMTCSDVHRSIGNKGVKLRPLGNVTTIE
jgi:hypothetical protein